MSEHRDHRDFYGIVTVLVIMILFMLLASRAGGSVISDALTPYHGMTERGYNRGAFIDTANRWARVPMGSPYCASAGGYIVSERLGLVRPPSVPARARAWLTANAIDAKRVWRGIDTVPYPCIAIWTRAGGGHFGIAVSATRHFEFNTSPDSRGSQWNGKWSGWKHRGVSHMAPTNPYRITHFIPLPVADHTGGGYSIQSEDTAW